MNGDRAADTGIVRFAAAINLVLGTWLFVSPWVYGAAGQPNAWNSWIAGAIIAIAAAVRFATGAIGANWLNMALGVWVFFSPWIFAYTGNTGRFINSLGVGVVVSILAAIANRGRRTQAVPH